MTIEKPCGWDYCPVVGVFTYIKKVAKNQASNFDENLEQLVDLMKHSQYQGVVSAAVAVGGLVMYLTK